jgi:hypothetical protein
MIPASSTILLLIRPAALEHAALLRERDSRGDGDGDLRLALMPADRMPAAPNSR